MSVFSKTNFPTCENPIAGIETLLRLIFIELGKQNAIDGMMIVDDTMGIVDVDHYAVIPREDTVIDVLSINGVSVLTDYNIDGETLTTEDPAIMAPKDMVFDAIEVDSGSVWVLLKL